MKINENKKTVKVQNVAYWQYVSFLFHFILYSTSKIDGKEKQTFQMIDCTWFTKFNHFKSIVFIEINCTKQKILQGDRMIN